MDSAVSYSERGGQEYSSPSDEPPDPATGDAAFPAQDLGDAEFSDYGRNRHIALGCWVLSLFLWLALWLFFSYIA